MAYLAKPYDPFDGDPLKNVHILDALVAHPDLLDYPMEPQEARQFWAGVLMNPTHVVFEAWQDGSVVGIILLTRIVPHVDAVLTFVFTDKNLVGKRKLLTNFIRFCFDELGFHRLSMEVPEGARVERFARKVLGFSLEGESRPRNPELPKSLTDNFVARQGSRREQCRWDGENWTDVVMLRLLATEI